MISVDFFFSIHVWPLSIRDGKPKSINILFQSLIKPTGNSKKKNKYIRPNMSADKNEINPPESPFFHHTRTQLISQLRNLL
jgi:hypothetical protein